MWLVVALQPSAGGGGTIVATVAAGLQAMLLSANRIGRVGRKHESDQVSAHLAKGFLGPHCLCSAMGGGAAYHIFDHEIQRLYAAPRGKGPPCPPSARVATVWLR